ncbi:MAG: hypothetical protein QOI34_1268 [Verrucomicrobiota bacterium]
MERDRAGNESAIRIAGVTVLALFIVEERQQTLVAVPVAAVSDPRSRPRVCEVLHFVQDDRTSALSA